jgi:hypothetical protein
MELFTLLGLGVPLSLGATTYGIFWWLDNNIADEHSQAISSWLNGRSANKPDLGNLIIYAIDRIYTSPLWSFRAFRRSAAISTIAWIVLFLMPWLADNRTLLTGGDPLQLQFVDFSYYSLVKIFA